MAAAAAAADLVAEVDDPPAAVIVMIYRSLAQVSVPERAVAGLAEASAQAESIGEPALDRLARAFRVVSQLAAGTDGDFAGEMEPLVAVPSDGYDRYICVWAAWITALVDRDGARLRRWMDQQLENVRRSGLRENWLTQFSHALTAMGEGRTTSSTCAGPRPAPRRRAGVPMWTASSGSHTPPPAKATWRPPRS